MVFPYLGRDGGVWFREIRKGAGVNNIKIFYKLVLYDGRINKVEVL